MTAKAARTIAAAFISSRIDYCNSLLCDLPNTLLRNLQSVQNATTQLITGTRRHDYIMPTLLKFHWLSMRECVKFKVACLVRQSLSGQAPVYLADNCCLVSDSTRYSPRSADVQTCMVPWTYSSYGDRTLQPLDLVEILTSQTMQSTDCFDDSLRDTFLGTTNTALSDFWYVAP